MNITKERLIEIIKEEVINESGGVASNFGGAAMQLGAQRDSGNDMPDHDLYGPQQTAEDNFVGILIDIGRMLDIWEQKEYPSDELDEGIEHMTPENIFAFIEMLGKMGTNLWPVGVGAAIAALHDKYQEDKREKERSGEGAPVPPRDDM